ncbi:post-PEP-CTERM-1 domain-containing protein [Massilia sp. DWR3-1-1]|uniref:post-PEP-CTERM-1 domain-containing protein n=1 Tax=Massilia sp. DWR3-1-1 TaxID=2804559 RepID=UPI003CF192F3
MKRLSVLPLAAMAALTAACATAQDRTSEPDGAAPPMVAVRDPQTGQLRAASAAELRALGSGSLSLRPSAGQLSVRADGRRQLHLGEAALVHLVVRRDADGHVTGTCMEGHEQAPPAQVSHAQR